ncbi:MAG: hypothetical protein AB7P99_21230 [Vicinamibacterales bacterium]
MFSLLLGTGIGSVLSRRIPADRVRAGTLGALGVATAIGVGAVVVLPTVIDAAIVWPLPVRIGLAALLLVPTGTVLGMPLPGGMRLLAPARGEIVPWGWASTARFRWWGRRWRCLSR